MMGKEKSAYIGCFYSLLAIILLMLAGLIFGGCRSVMYVPVETIKHDSIYFSRLERDSVYLHDSIRIKEKADTILIERWHTRYRDRILTDTIYISRVDTISVPYPVERQLTRAERQYITIGKWAGGVIAGLLIALIGYFFFIRKI